MGKDGSSAPTHTRTRLRRVKNDIDMMSACWVGGGVAVRGRRAAAKRVCEATLGNQPPQEKSPPACGHSFYVPASESPDAAANVASSDSAAPPPLPPSPFTGGCGTGTALGAPLPTPPRGTGRKAGRDGTGVPSPGGMGAG